MKSIILAKKTGIREMVCSLQEVFVKLKRESWNVDGSWDT